MQPEALAARLAEGVLLLDGGLGSIFISQGLEAGQAPEHWLFEHPDRIVAAHRSYVEAGADVIHTVSFGGSPLKLETAGLGGRCREVNRTAVELARRASGDRTLVAGDVGPTGAFLPPMGEASEEQLVGAFREQVEVLAEAGVDLISIETMFDFREALAAVTAAAETGLPVFASMTFETRKRGHFTIMGDKIAPSLGGLREAGALAVGFNCSVESGPMVEMVREAVTGLSAPVIAQPNAGQPRATADGIVYDAEPEQFVADLMRMVEVGARAVGGCCGTDPRFIEAARAALDARAGQ